MDKSKAIEMLNQCLIEIPKLKVMHYGNQEFKLWCARVETITKKWLDADDYEKLDSVQSKYFLDELATDHLLLEEDYLPKVKDYETALKSIIQKYEILGIEEKSAVKPEPNDTVKLPLQLFDALHLHPRVIQVSKPLFKTGNYAQSILEAFKAVNNFVKEKSGLSPNDMRGMKDSQLMAKVFDVNNPIIKLNELLSDTDISEQEGFKFLFMGATVGIRNPKAHDFIEMKDPYKTLEYLAFASLLLKKISFWKAD